MNYCSKCGRPMGEGTLCEDCQKATLICNCCGRELVRVHSVVHTVCTYNLKLDRDTEGPMIYTYDGAVEDRGSDRLHCSHCGACVDDILKDARPFNVWI